MGKRLVVCCDGTWNFADQPSKTNVAKIALSVRPGSAADREQRVCYHSGVGILRQERLRGGAFGMGLSRNVLDAYRFLVESYEPDDDLYLFGFSRGAFTVRSPAGLVRNSGILRRDHVGRTREAWALYRDRVERPTDAAVTLFRRTYARETPSASSAGGTPWAPWGSRPPTPRACALRWTGSTGAGRSMTLS